MRLSCLTEETDLRQLILSHCDAKPANKLLRWASTKREYTDKHQLDNTETVVSELTTGRRLVANPWKENIKIDELSGFDVRDWNKQLMIALPENTDILGLVMSSGLGSIIHAVRGLAFGYDPSEVSKYVSDMISAEGWKQKIADLGIKTSGEHPKRGYASVADSHSGELVVEPSEYEKALSLAPKLGTLTGIVRWCPECYKYVHVAGVLASVYDDTRSDLMANDCEHKPADSDAGMNDRHWYSLTFEF